VGPGRNASAGSTLAPSISGETENETETADTLQRHTAQRRTAQGAQRRTAQGAVVAQAAAAVASAAEKYALFTGRATRSEFWWWSAFLSALLSVLAAVQLLALGDGTRGPVSQVATQITEILFVLLVLALFVPSQAVLVRRLHDVNLSGWYALLGLIPLLGGLILCALALLPTAATAPDATDTPDVPAREAAAAVFVA
jgi:uncharacterized membrane protein YhaH (DUF805 family)